MTASNNRVLHFVYDRIFEGRYVPNGLAPRGPMWQRFVRQEDEYAKAYCKTPLLALFEAEGIEYRQSMLSDTDFDSNNSTPVYLLEMLYSFRVWLPLKSGENFVMHPFEQISTAALEAMRERKLRLVVTHIKRPEQNGYQWELFTRFYGRLREFGIPPEQVYFLGCDEDLIEHYEATLTHRPDLVRLAGVTKFPYFERGWQSYFKNYLAQGQTYTLNEAREDLSRIRPKKYLNFNREPRAHRRVVAGWLYQNRFIDDGLISFPAPEGSFLPTKFDEYREGVQNVFRDTRLIEYGEVQFAEFAKDAPYLVDSPDLLKLHISWCTKAPFRDTYFSILTERLYRSENGHALLTSKAFKAMCNMHPFVMIGAHRSLQFLREMGYRTFSPMINEQYDLEPDSDRRMQLALNEIERLIRLSDQQWLELQNDMMPILEHNYQLGFVRQKVPLLSYLPGL